MQMFHRKNGQWRSCSWFRFSIKIDPLKLFRTFWEMTSIRPGPQRMVAKVNSVNRIVRQSKWKWKSNKFFFPPTQINHDDPVKKVYLAVCFTRTVSPRRMWRRKLHCREKWTSEKWEHSAKCSHPVKETTVKQVWTGAANLVSNSRFFFIDKSRHSSSEQSTSSGFHSEDSGILKCNNPALREHDGHKKKAFKRHCRDNSQKDWSNTTFDIDIPTEHTANPVPPMDESLENGSSLLPPVLVQSSADSGIKRSENNE